MLALVNQGLFYFYKVFFKKTKKKYCLFKKEFYICNA